jgi:hypothetical protein
MEQTPKKTALFVPHSKPESWRDARTHSITFRLSPNEVFALKEVCRVLHMERSEFVRMSLLASFESYQRSEQGDEHA